jgi:anti-sigma factor RsiW
MQRGEEEIIDLVNAVVDGEATAEEETELRRLLLTSPQVRELFDSTREIARRLEEMRSLEPPSELRRSILEQCGGRLLNRPVQKPATTRRRIFAYGWAAAAALVLAFLILGRRPMTDTGATMAPAWPIVQKIVSERATLIVRRHADLYELEPVVSGSPVSIDWDESKLTFIGVSDKKDASFGKASVKFTLHSPSQRAGVIVRPRDGASAAEVRVSVGNDEVLRVVISLR